MWATSQSSTAVTPSGVIMRLPLRKSPWTSDSRSAGAAEADLLIAATLADEGNMRACQVAPSIFDVPPKIARIREQSCCGPDIVWSSPRATAGIVTLTKIPGKMVTDG